MSNDHDISVLNSLITTTIDSANGFERSAEDAKSGRFQSMFREYAGERRQMVAKLQDQVRKFGGTPSDDGSLTANLHRRWEDLKSALSGDSDKAVIEEVERGEDYIKEKYEEALKDDKLSPESRSVIQEAYTSVRSGHDKASQLKHSMEGAA